MAIVPIIPYMQHNGVGVPPNRLPDIFRQRALGRYKIPPIEEIIRAIKNGTLLHPNCIKCDKQLGSINSVNPNGEVVYNGGDVEFNTITNLKDNFAYHTGIIVIQVRGQESLSVVTSSETLASNNKMTVQWEFKYSNIINRPTILVIDNPKYEGRFYNNGYIFTIIPNTTPVEIRSLDNFLKIEPPLITKSAADHHHPITSLVVEYTDINNQITNKFGLTLMQFGWGIIAEESIQ